MRGGEEMQVDNIQISNGSYKNNHQNIVKPQEGFSQILGEIMELSEEDLLQGLEGEISEEDETKFNMEEAINLIFNMPLIDNREVKISMPIDKVDEALEGIYKEKSLNIKGDLISFRELESFNDNKIIKEGDLDLKENKVYFQEGDIQKLDIDIDLVPKVKEEIPISKDVSIKDDSLKDKIIEDIHISKENKPILDKNLKVQEDNEISTKIQGGKMDLDKESSLEKRKIENKEWTTIDIGREQPKFIETKVNSNFQDNILPRENLEIINNSIIQLMETTTKEGNSTMKVKLYPEELGSVDITLTMDEGKLVAKILVDSDHVKQLFANSIEELNQNLLKQNIHIGDVQVDLNNSSSGNQQQKDGNYFAPRRNFNFDEKVISSKSSEDNVYETGAVSILA